MPRTRQGAKSESSETQSEENMAANFNFQALQDAIVQGIQGGVGARPAPKRKPNKSDFKEVDLLNTNSSNYVTNISQHLQRFSQDFIGQSIGCDTPDRIEFWRLILEDSTRTEYNLHLVSHPLTNENLTRFLTSEITAAELAANPGFQSFEMWVNERFKSDVRAKANHDKMLTLQRSTKFYGPKALGVFLRTLMQNSVGVSRQMAVTEEMCVQLLYHRVDPRIIHSEITCTAFREYNANPAAYTFEKLAKVLDDEGTRLGVTPQVADGEILSFSLNSEGSNDGENYDAYWTDVPTPSAVGSTTPSFTTPSILFAGVASDAHSSQWSDFVKDMQATDALVAAIREEDALIAAIREEIHNFDEEYDDSGFYTDDDDECMKLTNVRNNSKIQCWSCGKFGHFATDCKQKNNKFGNKYMFPSVRQKRFQSHRPNYPRRAFSKNFKSSRFGSNRNRPRRRFFKARFKRNPKHANRAHFVADDVYNMSECSVEDLESPSDGFVYFFKDDSSGHAQYYPLGFAAA